MQPLSCVIIDDEPIARNILKEYILRDDRLLLVQDYSNASDALRELGIKKPRLIFLDIKMPKINGFEMLRSMPQHPQVIFTTAFREYAVDGFDLNAVDYLLKPFSFERFLQAINKAYILLSPELSGEPTLVIPADNPDNDLFVKSNGKLIRIRLQDIYYIEALKEYIRIFTPDGAQVVYQTMQNMQEKLPQDLFFRIHRSYIIGLRHIKAIEGNSVLVYKTQLPISRSIKDQFIKTIAGNKLL
jgi:DNA-binding LytR/AlgR family response regulator